MKNDMLTVAFPVLASLLSSLLLTLAFPLHDIGWLAWVALVPLLIAITGRSPLFNFLLCSLFGIAVLTGIFFWLFQVPGYRVYHHALNALYLGPLLGLFGLTFGLIRKRMGVFRAYLASPFLWTSLEFLRGHLGFLSLPWSYAAHSQYQNLVVIQIASITGAYGVSFLIASVNAAVAFLLLPYAPRHLTGTSRSELGVNKRQTGFVAAGATVLVLLTLVFGFMALSMPLTGKSLKTTVIQGNIDQTMKANPLRNAQSIMAKYTAFTRAAAQEGADLIVWPEAATPGFVLKHLTLRNQIVSLVREINRPFLIGSSEYPKFVTGRDYKKGEAGNTALYLSPKGKVLGQYLKIRLAPFGEYVPLEGIIPWPSFIVPPDKKSFEVPGTDYTLFDIQGTKFGVVICWEIVFPDFFSEFVRRGAEFMMNLTNEGWFGDTAAPYQLLAMAVFRCVENRVSMARAANTGISCFIDPRGRITGRVEKNGKDVCVDGYLTQGIPLSHEWTFYTRYGDIFIFLVMAVAVGWVGLAAVRTKRGARTGQSGQ